MLHKGHLYHFVVSIHFHNVYDAVFVICDRSQWNEDDRAIDSLPLTLVRKILFATIGSIEKPNWDSLHPCIDNKFLDICLQAELTTILEGLSPSEQQGSWRKQLLSLL